MPGPQSFFEDVKIIKLIFLHYKDRHQISETFCVLNKKISSVLRSAPFKSEWIIKNGNHQLDLWLQAFLKRVNLESSQYQDWIANQVYHTPSKPSFIENLMNDRVIVSRLINHYGPTLDRVKGLWVYLLVNRSLVGISLVLENAIYFQVLLSTPWLLKSCIFACIFTPFPEDGEKGLAVLKFILDNSSVASLAPHVVQEALALACQLDLAGHVEALAPLCSEEKRAWLWVEISAKVEKTNNADIILTTLASTLSANHTALLNRTKSILEEGDSDKMYLRFEQLVLENSSRGFGPILREIWCVLNESCIRRNDIAGVHQFASFYSQDEHLILPLSQFALAIEKGLDVACDELLPLVDCVVPGTTSPTLQDRLSTLFTEYCKTPKKVLFAQLNITPSFAPAFFVASKKVVVENQLAVIAFLYGRLKKLRIGYKIQSPDVWESIQAENTELAALFQNWGASPSWMEDSDNSVNKKAVAARNQIFAEEASFAASISDDDSDTDAQSAGMFLAFDGERKSFKATKKMSYSQPSPLMPKPAKKLSLSSAAESVGVVRVNIFESDKKAGHGSSILGARRIQAAVTPVVATVAVGGGGGGGHGVGRKGSFMGQFNQQSNQIWDAYFKLDAQKLQKLMSDTSLATLDWMEVQGKTSGVRGLKAGAVAYTAAEAASGSAEDRALLQKYTQLY